MPKTIEIPRVELSPDALSPLLRVLPKSGFLYHGNGYLVQLDASKLDRLIQKVTTPVPESAQEEWLALQALLEQGEPGTVFLIKEGF